MDDGIPLAILGGGGIPFENDVEVGVGGMLAAEGLGGW